ncbi:MAG: galactokinase, partial [Bacteroidota bacterium]
MINREQFTAEFFSLYGEPEYKPMFCFAPGRVNLIGEHTDYNGGYVLPCALQYGTYLLIRRNETGKFRFSSSNYTEKATLSSTEPITKQGNSWFNYPLGVMKQFSDLGYTIPGLDFYFYGDIPGSAGLSSSASIEMVTAFALNEILGSGFKMLDLVKIAKKAENTFVGVNCGIMDMFAVGMGETNHAIFLNCTTLEYKLIPVLIPGFTLVVANTMKVRGLADSKYNERVEECKQAVVALSKLFSINSLSEVAFPKFFKLQDQIEDEVVRRRARHIISENQRVQNAVNSLLKSDLLTFGSLMNSSHDSLRDNYEVTGFELDTLVEEATRWFHTRCQTHQSYPVREP